jgi:hypothetical protein
MQVYSTLLHFLNIADLIAEVRLKKKLRTESLQIRPQHLFSQNDLNSNLTDSRVAFREF